MKYSIRKIGIIIAYAPQIIISMKKSAWLLCLLCVVSIGQLYAQKGKSEKKQKKEFLEAVVPACVSFMENDANYANMAKAMNTQGYCTCMVEDLVTQYTITELTDLFTNPKYANNAYAFLENETNVAKTMQCMKDNVTDEAAMKTLILRNSFGQETCMASMAENGLAEQVNTEGYCSCMFERMESQFTLAELLSESTYESDKFKVMAMECVVANSK